MTITITEFATLELIAPYTIDNPDPLLAELFGRGAQEQAAWSGHELHFFTNLAAPSEIHIITGWKDVSAHEKWIASDQNQGWMMKFGRLLKVKGLAHLDMDFNTMPVDNQTLICEKYEQPPTEARLTGGKEDRGVEADVLEGSEKDVEWVGSGKDLEPKANGTFYKFTSCTDRWRDKIVASATQNREVTVTVLKRIDTKTLRQS